MITFGGGIVSLTVGNTETAAKMIRELTGGDAFRIDTVKAYPADYTETTEVAQQELRQKARPELSGRVDDMDDYGVIFLGYPNWWGTMPMAVFTFLDVKGDLDARKLHVCLTTWGFILMGVHLGFHGSMVTGLMMKLMKNLEHRTRKRLLRLAAGMIFVYGAYASFTHDSGAKLIMYYGFSFRNPDRSELLFLTNLFAVLGLYACAAHYCMKGLRITLRQKDL